MGFVLHGAAFCIPLGAGTLARIFLVFQHASLLSSSLFFSLPFKRLALELDGEKLSLFLSLSLSLSFFFFSLPQALFFLDKIYEKTGN